MYSQDLSNCTTTKFLQTLFIEFLYSQDLSNRTTEFENYFSVSSFCTLKI
ncbi:conserved protein of unknown function [Streptococcus thermophilus]|nr:conserved protein of unknown function [Streptococcus thermophilus]